MWAGVQIRQQEIATRKKIASNPVKMDAIKREVAQIQAAQQAAKAQKKAAKLAKKDAKRAKKDERNAEKRHAKLKVGAASSQGHSWSCKLSLSCMRWCLCCFLMISVSIK